MNDPERWAGRFSTEVDRILEQHSRAEESGPPAEYTGLLILAGQLAALDFSQNSSMQSPLRRQLVSRLNADIAARRRLHWGRRILWPRPRRALGAFVALVALVAVLGWTPAGQAVAQAVGQLIRELRWSHTRVQQVTPQALPQVSPGQWEQIEAQAAAGRAWQFSFEGYRFGACCFDEPVRDEAVSLAQAQAEAGFAFQVPTFLPAGFALREVRLLGVAPFDVVLVFEGPDARLALFQSAVGVLADSSRRVINIDTAGAVEVVMVGETQAAVLQGEWLVWEAGGISFYLIGPDLDLPTLVHIAESLAPVNSQ